MAKAPMHAFLCVLMAFVLAIGMTPTVPHAFAANEEKPDTVYMQLPGKPDRIDVMKQVANLDANMGKGASINFDVRDKYYNLAAGDKKHALVFEDSSGKQTKLSEGIGDRISMTSDQLVVGQKLKLITSTKDKSGNFVKRYEQQLNVRVIDTKKAEKNSSAGGTGAGAGISSDGSTWSLTDGMNIDIKGTGFKFLDGTSISLGGMMLPLKYKHDTDGTTIVGINCDPNNEAFYKAVKNGNPFQKYSSEKMLKMVEQMEKGWSGKGFGKWGGKAFDWNVMGYMEYNTKNPDAPRALNLIISMGIKAEGHAQYLCFTGSITFTAGGKATLVGKFTPAKGVDGKFGLGGYGALELYIGLGLNYVASIGTYGKGQINIDFQVLPKFFLDTIKLSGAFGVKAKVFGFTIFNWTILQGEKLLYPKEKNGKKMPAMNADGTATSPFNVDADTVYPVDSRDYLENGTDLTAGQSDLLTAQASSSASTILEGIYGETELACATTNSGPVIVYIADAAQVGGGSREDANRNVLVYKRMNSDGTWSKARIIDTSATKDCADYSPTIHTDGDNCYVTWLAAKEEVTSQDKIGEVGKKLDVKVATITKGAQITDDTITIDTVLAESENTDSMPANPAAVKVGSDLYVGWYTNQTSGSEGEVIGVSGNHNIRLYKKSGSTWTKVSEVTSGQNGAITSFDVGVYGGKAACAWSLDAQFAKKYTESANTDDDTSESKEKGVNEGIGLNSTESLAASEVYALTPDSSSAVIVATKATNAQFAKQEGNDALTYATLNDANDGISNPYVSVQSSPAPGNAGSVVLDGSKVYLPTTHYEITGDLGKGRAGNISFLKTGNGTCDIQALVTTGAGNTDWTSILEATADTATITDYCATYANGLPLFIYTTERVLDKDAVELNGQAEDNGSVDMSQTTDASLKHLSVIDIDYDEYEAESGQKMPITVYFENDGMLDVTGVDLWKLEDGAATKVASSNDAIAIGEESLISFDYTIPPKDQFTKAREFTLYAAPANSAVTANKITRELADESAMNVSFGAASLALETNHQIVNDQESIVATVTNDGIAPHGAKLVFLNSDTGDTLKTVDVPELGESQTFTATYDAPSGYFQNDGVNNITITLEDDGTENEGYDINNTEFVNTWEVIPDEETPAADDTTGTKATSASPKSGDAIAFWIILALIVAAAVTAPIAIRAYRRTHK